MSKAMSKAIFYYFITALFLIYEIALSVSPSVMSQNLMHAIHVNAVGYAFISSAYYATYMLMQIPGGLLIDSLGLRRVTTLSVLICSLGTYCFAVSNSFYLLLFARLLMGAGSATAFVSLLTLARTQFPEKYFALLSGLAISAASLGAILGQMLIAQVLTVLTWRQCMLMTAGVGVLIALIIWQGLAKMKQYSDSHAVHSLRETKRHLRQLLRKPQVLWIASFSFLNVVPLAAFADLWGVSYFGLVYHINNTQAALLSAIIWLGFGIASPLFGYFSEALGNRRQILFIMTVLSMIATISILYAGSISFNMMLPIMFLLGAACSGQSVTFPLIKDNTSVDVCGTACAINNAAVVSTPIIFQTVVGALINYHANVKTTVTHYQLADYTYALSLLPLVCGLSFIVAVFFIKETHCQSAVDDNINLEIQPLS